MNVVFLTRMEGGERERWHDHLRRAAPEMCWLDPAAARARPEAVQAAVVANPPAGALQGFEHLRVIQSLWAGVERLLDDPTLPTGVPLLRMIDPAMSRAMAETVVWAVVALQRDFFVYQRQQGERRWQPHRQRRADEVPVLVLGHGEMGRCAAQALAVLGFPVTAWRRAAGGAASIDPPEGVRVSGAPLASLLPEAQVLVNLLPLTAATRGVLNAETLRALPRGAGIVNLARGAHVVDADLLAALDEGHLAHAVLDVFHSEPLPVDHPYWRHPQVTVLPHVAAATDPRSASEVVASNLRAVAAGRWPAGMVRRERGY